jgi:hypothetical protein
MASCSHLKLLSLMSGVVFVIVSSEPILLMGATGILVCNMPEGKDLFWFRLGIGLNFQVLLAAGSRL